MVPIPYQPCSGWLDGLPLHICNSGVRPGRLFEGCWLFEAEGRHGQTLWTRRRIEDTRPSALTPPTPQTSHAGHRLSHRKKSISCSPQQPQTQLAHPRLVACLRRPPARHRSTSIGPHPPCSENREDRRDGIGSSVLLASFIQPPGSPEVPPHLSASWPQRVLSAPFCLPFFASVFRRTFETSSRQPPQSPLQTRFSREECGEWEARRNGAR